MRWPLLIAAVLALAGSATAKLVERDVVYGEGDPKLEGFLVTDDAWRGPRPVVLIIHDWNGLGDYEKKRARMIAQLGYVAFAVDIYGQGVRPTQQADMARLSGTYKRDRELYRRRLQSALDFIVDQREVDRRRIAAIGYCFGGTGALELARMGAPVRGVVSFHGGLDASALATVSPMKTEVLVCHGADDPFVPPAQVAAFREEMRKARAKMIFEAYPGAVHSFTDPEAGNDPKRGAAYNKAADEKSWNTMRAFLARVLK